MVSRSTKNYNFPPPHCRLRPLCHGTSSMNLMSPESSPWATFLPLSVVIVVERRMIGIAECVMTVQGHPRSMILVSTERLM